MDGIGPISIPASIIVLGMVRGETVVTLKSPPSTCLIQQIDND